MSSTPAPPPPTPPAKLQSCGLKIKLFWFVLMILFFNRGPCGRFCVNETLEFSFPAVELLYKRIYIIIKHVDERRHRLLSSGWWKKQNIFVTVVLTFHWKTVLLTFYRILHLIGKVLLTVYRILHFTGKQFYLQFTEFYISLENNFTYSVKYSVRAGRWK